MQHGILEFKIFTDLDHALFSVCGGVCALACVHTCMCARARVTHTAPFRDKLQEILIKSRTVIFNSSVNNAQERVQSRLLQIRMISQ